jgi:hypothetical protein
VALTQTLSRRFAIGVGCAQVGITSEDLAPVILAGHELLLSDGALTPRIVIF